MKTEEQLEKEVADLYRKAREFTREANKLDFELAAMRSEFKAGQVIQWPHGRKGQIATGRILAVCPWGFRGWFYKVIRIRKDGTEGDTVDIHSYHKPTLATEQPQPSHQP